VEVLKKIPTPASAIIGEVVRVDGSPRLFVA